MSRSDVRFHGELWTEDEQHQVLVGLEVVDAIEGPWHFDKFNGWRDGRLRWAINHDHWRMPDICDSFSELMIRVRGKI